MPRAHRYFLPNHIWHITHRCHKKEFLLKFARDRKRLRYWLFEARKRYGLCVLNYIITSNHIHLLVLDQGQGERARSMQLIAGRTAQEYNLRKQRKGAYWEDRYHATAVDSDNYLAHCITYIDMNMVRAGVVSHPADWPCSGYHEIQSPPQRYAVIDQEALMKLFAMESFEHFQAAHKQWLATALRGNEHRREARWSECLAVGHKLFVKNVKAALNSHAKHRAVIEEAGKFMLREPTTPYSADFNSKIGGLSHNNGYYWDDNP